MPLQHLYRTSGMLPSVAHILAISMCKKHVDNMHRRVDALDHVI